MYEQFTGKWEEVYNKTVFCKRRNKFIPCLVTNYYFKPKKYTLVPIDDLGKEPQDRRLFFTSQVFVVPAT